MPINKSFQQLKSMSTPTEDSVHLPQSTASSRYLNFSSHASYSVDGTKNTISSSLRKGRGSLTRMLSVDMEGFESMHQRQLNLQHQCQQKMLRNSNQKDPQTKSGESSEINIVPATTFSKSSTMINFHEEDTSNHSIKTICNPIPVPGSYQALGYSSSKVSSSNHRPQSHHHLSANHHYKSRTRRNLSEEGMMRVQTFQQTHSASHASAPSQKILRFSADGPDHISSSQSYSRSASCLPLSRFRGSSASREGSSSRLSRPSSGEYLNRSFDRMSLSPNKSLDKGTSSENIPSCSKHRNPDKKCEKCCKYQDSQLSEIEL